MAESEVRKVTVEVRRHPYIAAGVVVVVGGIIIWYYYGGSGGSSSSSSTVVSAGGPSPAELAAGVQMAGIQASAQTAHEQIQGQLAALATKGGTDLALANIAAGVQGEAIGVQAQGNQLAAATTLHGQDVSLDAILAQLNERGHEVDVSAATTVTEAALLSQTNEFVAAQNAQTEQAINEMQGQVAEQQIAGNVILGQAQIAGNVQIVQANDTMTQTIAQAVADTQTNIAHFQSDAAMSIADSQARAQIGVAKAQAGAQEAGGLFGMVGGIVKAFL